jgi:hypothetical protein
MCVVAEPTTHVCERGPICTWLCAHRSSSRRAFA